MAHRAQYPAPARRPLSRPAAALAFVGVLAARLVVSSEATAEEPKSPASASRETSTTLDFAATTGATALASPLILTGARGLGSATPNLLTSALPALALSVVGPAAVATFVTAERRSRDGRPARSVPILLATVGVELILFSGFVAAGGTVKDTGDLFALSAAQGVLLGVASTVAAEVSAP